VGCADCHHNGNVFSNGVPDDTFQDYLATNHIQVIKDTHGKTSHLSATDIDALIDYLRSLEKSAKP
jgi:hypothetical protein